MTRLPHYGYRPASHPPFKNGQRIDGAVPKGGTMGLNCGATTTVCNKNNLLREGFESVAP